MINEVIIPILILFANVVTTVVIVQFILSLLLSFNVVDMRNNIVASIWQSLNAILDPILNPIRRKLPRTGMIDLSPMVLLISIQIALIVLSYVGRQLV
jgi:YggT family protein